MLRIAPKFKDRLALAGRRLEILVEQRPGRAFAAAFLLTLVIVGLEASYWPLHDYPGAMWHHQPRGDEIEIVQARAAAAGWKELAGYWTGRIIHGNAYYQPLTSWLFVAEYHLFRNNDRHWALFGLVLHLALTALLVWVTGVFVLGSLLRRLGTGVLAAFLMGAPGLADREAQGWIIGWWPAQPDPLSLSLGLILLAAVTLYARTRDRKLAVLAPILFFLAVCFKETAYVAGVGACLLLVRRPRSWGLLALLAASGLAFFALRCWALRDAAAFGHDNSPIRALKTLGLGVLDFGGTLNAIWPHLLLLTAGIALSRPFRRRWGLAERGVLGFAIYLVLSAAWLGPPWDPYFCQGFGLLAHFFWSLLVLAGLLLSFRNWPIPELFIIYLLTEFLAMCFPPVFAWHRYWSDAFASILMANALVLLGEYLWRRLPERGPSGALPASPQQEPDGAIRK